MRTRVEGIYGSALMFRIREIDVQGMMSFHSIMHVDSSGGVPSVQMVWSRDEAERLVAILTDALAKEVSDG